MKQKFIPSTLAQQRLWFQEQSAQDKYINNISNALRLIGPLNVTALEQSINKIINRHEALRVTFLLEEGQLIQQIPSTLQITLKKTDISQHPKAERLSKAQTLVIKESKRHFNILDGPLFRANLLQLDAEDHVLLLTLHNIICDDRSIDILIQELSVHYSAFSAGKSSPLPEPAIQYSDVALQQQKWLESENYQLQLSYWKQQLGYGIPVLQLPVERLRLMVSTYRRAMQSYVLPVLLSKSFKAFCQQEGAALSATLLAAFKTLIHRYTGQEDIIVGLLNSGRIKSDMEQTIGCFSSVLPIRTNLSGAQSFRSLIGQVKKTTIEAYENQGVPFEKIIEGHPNNRNESSAPLIQVMFRLQDFPDKHPLFSGLEVEKFCFDKRFTKHDLTLTVVDQAEGLHCNFEYNSELFDKASITRMKEHFRTLLDGIVKNPKQRISRLPILTKTERHQLLVEWNKTSNENTQGLLIHERFEEQVEKTPEAPAVLSEGQILTYRQLNYRINQLSHHLQKLGVGPEVLVGLFMERSLEAVIGFWGILGAGGACVPLDSAYPEDRIGFMLKDAQVQIILTQEKLLRRLPSHQGTVLCIDSDWEIIAQESKESVINAIEEGNLSFVFYTSGSTGKPKAVLLTHRRSNKDPSKKSENIRVTAADRHILKSPLGFTSFSAEITWPLLNGALMVIIPPGKEQDMKYLVNIMTEQDITFTIVVPSMLRMLLEEPELDKCGSLRQIACFGEPLPPEVREQLFARLDVDLIVIYGVTEAPSATSCKYESGDHQRKVNIGRCLPNRLVYILDSHLEPVPIGVVGEMYIGGSLARGYLNRPDLTAERFIANPFSSIPGERMYKTGDLGRYLADGTIEFMGRRDYQVNIQGFRIELGEVEAALARHPNVKDALVLVNENESGIRRLVSYVVPKAEADLNSSELRRFLQKQLPDYMTPSIFVVLDSLPLNPHGKIDRNALPKPGNDRPELETPLLAPQDELELQLTKTWEKVLGVQPIGVRDNFFEVGGHSLLAVRLITQIEKILGKNLPLATLFQAPSVEQLADILREQGWSAPLSSLEAIEIGGAGSANIIHKMIKRIPAKSHPYLKQQYHKIKKQPGYLYLKRQHFKAKSSFTKRFLSYQPLRLEEKLREIGLAEADTVYMHSAFNAFNGFSGGPQQIIDCILNVIGESGNLLMVSMAYNGSTEDYLKAVKTFDVIKTESFMGIITEIFRRKKDVVRSLNPAHPILAFGPDAKWIISDHDKTMYSCGKGSPFEKILELNAKAFFFDVPFRTTTFFHYLEDKFKYCSPVQLYDDKPLESTVIDSKGKEITVKTYVFSKAARENRNVYILERELKKRKLSNSDRIGNTKLIVANLTDVVSCAQKLVNSGMHFYYS
jgi:aspartate racemase